MDQRRDRVEALPLQGVLDAAVDVAGPDRNSADEEVQSLVSPAAGQNVVSLAGEGVSDQEVSMVLHQRLSNLCRIKSQMYLFCFKKQQQCHRGQCIPMQGWIQMRLIVLMSVCVCVYVGGGLRVFAHVRKCVCTS